MSIKIIKKEKIVETKYHLYLPADDWIYEEDDEKYLILTLEELLELKVELEKIKLEHE